jgi:DNA modification methylase
MMSHSGDTPLDSRTPPRDFWRELGVAAAFVFDPVATRGALRRCCVLRRPAGVATWVTLSARISLGPGTFRTAPRPRFLSWSLEYVEPVNPKRPRRSTSTSNFGVGRREGHDASGFYDRFRPPTLSADDTVLEPRPVEEPFVCGDARHMDTVADGSVALVVTSPPYFAGKQYEEELEREGVPSSYLDYLQMLTEVFTECVRTLEPGGRIAVNVANLGRKPYRNLAADVTRILEHDLGLLLRGELVWQKAEGASGSCAWGSFRSAANPVLRDVTERVIVASKGRFDRALTVKQRAAAGLPHENTLSADDFVSLTLDVWSIAPESAKRVGHPAPFPVELPEALIRLYTFVDDLVLDPFMGSGSALVAAARLGRRYVGYDLDPGYVALSRERVAAVSEVTAPLPAGGTSIVKLGERVLAEAGFVVTGRKKRLARTGVTADFTATDAHGSPWVFLIAGPLTSIGGGMGRSEVVWRTIGRAAAVRGRHPDLPVVVLTGELPRPKGEGDAALRAAGPAVVSDVVDVLDPAARSRLSNYARSGIAGGPLPGFWTLAEVARPLDAQVPVETNGTATLGRETRRPSTPRASRSE